VTRALAYLSEALASLRRNKVRSALTMLGMIIGSASIIAVFGISRAATTGISSTFSSFGLTEVVVLVDQSQDYPDQAQVYDRDVAPVREALGADAINVFPEWNRTLSVSYASHHEFYSVASDTDYHPDSLAMLEGRKIDAADIESGARVCVLTSDIARTLFGNQPATGNFIRINGGQYEVVGVYADIKGSFLNSIAGSSNVAVPYTTYFNFITQDPMDFLLVYPADPSRADATGKEAVAALQRIHGLHAKYTVQNTADALNSFENVLNIIGVGLSAIGAVALVVAGIGIMNIMLVSVTERTREIGIRKSIGANRGDIAAQFVMEAVLLSLIGGGIGTGLGLLATIGAVSLLSKQLGAMIVPYLLIVSMALIFSLLVGTAFGSYPALRAARMDPIEALRS
jgi:putative ABC transport system permease protein